MKFLARKAAIKVSLTKKSLQQVGVLDQRLA